MADVTAPKRRATYLLPGISWEIESWATGDDRSVNSVCVNSETGERRVILHEDTPDGYAGLRDCLGGKAYNSGLYVSTE